MIPGKDISGVRKKKSAIVVGISSPIRVRSKMFVMRKLYDKAKRNPFVDTESFESYLKFIARQIEDVEGVKVKSNKAEDIYKTLKSLGWLREVNYMAFYVITTNYAIA
tara:strand:+ start:1249 stop:1572 length:324 start_codon:yes stop_codon:yes gene_type:complete